MKNIINIKSWRDNPDGTFDLWVVDEDGNEFQLCSCQREGAKLGWQEIKPIEDTEEETS